MWLYRLQQRLNMTPTEGKVLLVVAFLLLLGAGAIHFLSTAPELPEGVYDELDQAFDEVRASSDPVRSSAGADAEGTSLRSLEETLTVPINTATVIELQQLPGIGPALAERIVNYREEHGAFGSAEDLTKVRGIGPRTLEGLEAHVSLEE